jgi:YidC/Oxa1 family membrane protein insertase
VKEFSNETRLLMATALAVLVIAAWDYFYRPAAPPKPVSAPSSQQAPATSPQTQPPAPKPSSGAGSKAVSKKAPPTSTPAISAQAEETLVVENKLYRVTLANRGAVVRSWELKNYTDEKGRTLDLVHGDAGRQLGGWPLALALDDGRIETSANGALYLVTPPGATLNAPAEVQFAWSDGKIAVTKRLKFTADYLVEIETSLLVDGLPVQHSVAWLGGFGDATVYHAADQVRVVQHIGGKLNELEAKKLGVAGSPEQRAAQPGLSDYAGIVDHYFAAAFLPGNGGGLTLRHWKLDREVEVEGKKSQEPVAEIAVSTSADNPLRLRLFVGPMDLDELARVKPPLTDLVQFGWFGLISVPLFQLLKWIYHYVPNYGWAIILMTVGINFVLFPLKLQSWRSMQRMQKVAPEVRQIQDRYKKYSMRDPRRQEMNTEVMAVYKREGVNPMGGCLPMLLQMPIWIGLYQMLRLVIELRHAPWIWWIRDLSAPDPYYIIPVLMGVTMYAMQKMTPVTTTDPAQQRMMTLMPLMFGGMFVIFPVSSGLVLYILTSNLVGIAQQWFLQRSTPVQNGDKGKRGKNAKK